jgi:opacity protein-like surface antigen
MKFKKFFCSIVLFLSLVSAVNAYDFTDLLQDIAAQTACLGMYSKAETGVLVTSRYEDPPDWYTPPLMANRFASMSGDKTSTETFYGLCFNYAQFAWNDIKKYQAAYNKAGMKNQQWYIAGANAGDPYTIILYAPVPQEKATTTRNGVYLKENSRHNVYTHDGWSGHAWLWVQHKNGTWYWIDPIFTDNTGYVWWGIVQNGKEVQFYPYPKYCTASNYPSASITETHSTASTYTEYRPTYLFEVPAALILCYNAPFDFDSGFYTFGLSLSAEYPETKSIVPYIPFSLSVDFFTKDNINNEKERAAYKEDDMYYISRKGNDYSLILGTAFGYPVLDWLLIYAGGGLGLTWHDETGIVDSSYAPDTTYSYTDSKYDDDNSIDFAWKVNGGLRSSLLNNFLFLKLDVSFGTILGPTFGVGAGMIL